MRGQGVATVTMKGRGATMKEKAKKWEEGEGSVSLEEKEKERKTPRNHHHSLFTICKCRSSEKSSFTDGKRKRTDEDKVEQPLQHRLQLDIGCTQCMGPQGGAITIK